MGQRLQGGLLGIEKMKGIENGILENEIEIEKGREEKDK